MFILAKINFYDNILSQRVVYDDSLDSAYRYEALFVDNVIDEQDRHMSIEDIKQRYFDCDMMINILEVPD